MDRQILDRVQRQEGHKADDVIAADHERAWKSGEDVDLLARLPWQDEKQFMRRTRTNEARNDANQMEATY